MRSAAHGCSKTCRLKSEKDHHNLLCDDGYPLLDRRLIFAARMNSGQPAANVNLEFDAITAVILGGVSFVGGVGNMGGTILGIILIQSFNTGLTMVNVPSFWQYVAKGGLLWAFFQ